MSLIRQLWCVLLATLVLALLGSVGVNLVAARSYMQNHLQLENGHNAAALALALSQQHGDRSQIDLMLAAQFDTGAYGLLRFMPADGGTVFERIAEPYTHGAPTWFARLAAIDPVPGKAQVSDGWRSLGVIEVTGSVAEAHDALWQGSLQVFAALCAVGLHHLPQRPTSSAGSESRSADHASRNRSTSRVSSLEVPWSRSDRDPTAGA